MAAGYDTLFLFHSSLLLEALFLLALSEYCDFAPTGSSLVLDVVVVFGDVSTAVGTEVETCMMGMQGKETVERLTLLRAQWANP